MVHFLKTFVWVVVLSGLLHALPMDVEKALTKSGLSKSEVSIYIKELGSKEELISLHANTARTPASVIKVFTIYASLLKLGFSYRIPTTFYTVGKVKKGVLYGDLAVKAMGDPTLNTKDVEKIAKAFAQRGLHRIKGNILIDRTYFNVGTQNNSHFDEHTYSPYNAMPDAMMFNERISRVCVTPNKHSVVKKTVDNSYKVVDQLKLVNKKCRGKYSWPHVKIDNSHTMPWLILHGKISKKCGKRTISKVITKPYQSFYYALCEALKKQGITVEGTLRLKPLPLKAKRYYTHFSDTLEKIIAKTAKKSNNLYARHLMLLLGAQQFHAPSTLKKGQDAIDGILRKNGVFGNESYLIENGCGLSRKAKITAKLLSRVYEHAYTRYGKRWMQTLSIAGVDGTIRKRFRGTKVAKHAWMKTGTLKHVKNIGGYVQSQEGKYYSVVILVNSKKGNWRASFLQNEIIKWLRSYHFKGATSMRSLEEDASSNTLDAALY